MSTKSVDPCGTIVIEGAAFRWSVDDGASLTVSHPMIGSQTQPLANPESQARAVGRAMLGAATGFLEAVDDDPLPEGDPDPTIV
jgi:hypothetical protein